MSKIAVGDKFSFDRTRASIATRRRIPRDELTLEKLLDYGQCVRDSTGCLKWLAARTRPKREFRSGYPVINLRNEATQAVTRLVYELVHGEKPPIVMHKCDTPMCVDPEHLIGGTLADNNRDMALKGRARGRHSAPLRPSWDETWLKSAELIGTRSRCVRRQAGCVIVTAYNRVTAQGYNGPPAGIQLDTEMCDGFCPRATTKIAPKDYDNCIAAHAETNALMQSDRSLHTNGSAYVSTAPCFGCAKLLSNSGLKRVVTRVLPQDWYRDPKSTIEFIMTCGLDVIVFP